MFANNTGWTLYLKIYGLFIVCAYVVHSYVGKDNFNALFSIVNSVALFIVAIYFFKKHAIPLVKESIEQHRDEFQQLYNQSDALNSRKHLLEQRLVSEHELVEQLSDKVGNWRDTWIHSNKEKEQEQAQIRARLVEKRKIQSYYAARERARQEIANHAIDRARESL